MGLLVDQDQFKQTKALKAFRAEQYADALAGKKPKLVKANRSSNHMIPENGQHAVWVETETDEPSADRRSIVKRKKLTPITKEMFAQFVDKSGDFKNHVFVNAQKATIVHYPSDDAVDPIHAILNKVSVNEDETDLVSENENLKKQIAELQKDKPKRGRKPAESKDVTNTNKELKL